ncbi:1316_t:CDS:2 [Dentiscutata heterogama]|uniref:1316_t:CDS:1 n=1 Tax=Dentiscutata heterogama TaxID=1316150 RepID=A0ACA9LZY4_9GLOM|nr:1316_t:CDS:2 [Dentiscutata heterogama]
MSLVYQKLQVYDIYIIKEFKFNTKSTKTIVMWISLSKEHEYEYSKFLAKCLINNTNKPLLNYKETSFSSDSTESLTTDFHTPTLSPIVSFGNIFDQESDTNSIDKLVLNQTALVEIENLEQINPSIPKNTIIMEPENQANNNNNQGDYTHIYPIIDDTLIYNY